MTNTLKLKAKIIANGLTQSNLAKLMNLSTQSINYKINNKRCFSLSEINKLCKILNINDLQERFNIFFADNVDLNLHTN